MASVLRRDSRLLAEIASLTDPASRYVDMAIRLRPNRRELSGERTILPMRPAIGQRWDRITGRDAGAALRARVLDVREDALPFFDALLEGDHRVLVLTGGRQAGKSVSAATAALLLSVAMPGKLLAVVSPAYTDTTKIMRRILARLPAEWIAGRPRLSPPVPHLDLANGARMEFLSAHRPEMLRGETYAAVVADELPLWSREAYTAIRPAGIVAGRRFRLIATGTPNRKLWICELLRRVAEGGGALWSLASIGNPWISDDALLEMAAELGPDAYRQEIEGKPAEDTGLVYPIWKPTQHVAEPPAREHETRLFCREHPRLRSYHGESNYLVGHDWGHRVSCSIVFQAWRLPSGRWTLYAVDEVITRGGTAEQHADRLARRVGAGALVICDASDPTAKDGLAVLRTRMLRAFPVGDRNPPVEQRTAAVNNLLDETLHGKRPLIRVARACQYLRHALEIQPLVEFGDKPARPRKGEEGRALDVSHYPDAAGYLLWWLYPVRRAVEIVEAEA